MKIVFLDQNENRRKRQRSRDDAPVNVFKKSPGHDGRKFMTLNIISINNSYFGDWCLWFHCHSNDGFRRKKIS